MVEWVSRPIKELTNGEDDNDNENDENENSDNIPVALRGLSLIGHFLDGDQFAVPLFLRGLIVRRRPRGRP